MSGVPHPMSHGFTPVESPGARALVLGTLPSVRSLEAGQYYANPRNAFWRVMAELFGWSNEPAYDDRCRALVGAGVALWDVLKAGRRPGSLDASIVGGSATPNDFSTFYRTHRHLRAVFFNGATAEGLYDRLVRPHVPDPRGMRFARLPSTSPANTRLSYEAKVEAWRELAAVLEGPS